MSDLPYSITLLSLGILERVHEAHPRHFTSSYSSWSPAILVVHAQFSIFMQNSGFSTVVAIGDGATDLEVSFQNEVDWKLSKHSPLSSSSIPLSFCL